MNERIQKLAEQAGLKSMPAKLTIYKNDDETYSNVWEYPLEKFAELLIQQCIEQINKVEEKGDAHLGGGFFYDGTRLCRDAINQHFGVEE